MAFTAEVRTDLIGLVVGALNAAPGASFLSDLVTQYNNGASVAQIAAAMGETAQFKAIYPTFLTNQEFLVRMVDNIVGNSVPASEKTWAVNLLLADLNGGANALKFCCLPLWRCVK
jgi:uncharacterized ferredoxin-like protein